ncbi:hypothetical protein GPECTOR_19g268 [Gonium pectorale]|uniref:SNF2 N-terminal domain-containing protein n=1 Tax=Gonium pectorale TaxID=33097 RepID=A0A150GJ31_GONPE|nr:hypothetical protein GPECTOR_19g268 [Gonium pectorale]|eukprot:KXZ49817.1 hypothetical protein GPECTOR_19g268 [Gonium pectorale]
MRPAQVHHPQPLPSRNGVGSVGGASAGSAAAGAAGGGAVRQAAQAEPDFRGRCPYQRCPGVYQACNAPLVWKPPFQPFAPPQQQALQLQLGSGYAAAPPPAYEPTGHWRCSRHPDCGWRYYPHPRLREPVLSLEIVGDDVFKVVPFPGAEDAVASAGGVACVLAGAGLDLSRALTWQQARGMMRRRGSSGSSGYGAGSSGDGAGSSGDGSGDGGAGDEAGDRAEDAGAEQEEGAGAGEPGDDSGGGPDALADGERNDAALYFPLSCYEALLAPLPRHSSLFNAGSLIPEPVRRAYRGQFRQRASASEVSARLARMPPSLRAALMPFQRQGVEFGVARGGRCLIADEMGVGKTVQAIALAACYEDEWPLLCIVPASLRLVWAEELEKWLPHLRPSHIHVIEGKANRLTGRASRGQVRRRAGERKTSVRRRVTR